MILFRKAEALSQHLLQQKKKGLTVGFVPTMGALHKGHLSLIASSKKEQGLTVCSIFVNPRQFNNPDDFKHYPVTVEKDVQQLLESDCDVLFLPSVEEIYPPGYRPKHYALGALETVLEGRYRPGHFQGVLQVVDRLLQMVRPSVLYLGQKDYQQCLVIQKLIGSLPLQNAPEIKIGGTLREDDGLAMSSRNLRLNAAQRRKAPALYQQLRLAKERLAFFPIDEIREVAAGSLAAQGFKIDYFEIADARSLLPPNGQSDKLIALVAAHLDNVRLIDNLPLN